jgi:hypothetical protein
LFTDSISKAKWVFVLSKVTSIWLKRKLHGPAHSSSVPGVWVDCSQ